MIRGMRHRLVGAKYSLLEEPGLLVSEKAGLRIADCLDEWGFGGRKVCELVVQSMRFLRSMAYRRK